MTDAFQKHLSKHKDAEVSQQKHTVLLGLNPVYGYPPVYGTW